MSETRYLFVYGTLRPAADGGMGRAMRRRLADESTLVGGGKIPGVLLNLGRYPGLVARAGSSIVVGDVLELADAGRTWTWLDTYEGFDPREPQAGAYVREVRRVALDGGGSFDAWVYVLAREPAKARIIGSGDWLNR